MVDSPPYASAFGAAGLAPFGDGSPPARVVGFSEDIAAGSLEVQLPRACIAAERQGSMGGLTASLHRANSRENSREPDPLPRRLSITTTRSSLRVTAGRGRRVPTTIDEQAVAGGSGDDPQPAAALASQAPAQQPARPGMARASSGHIDMPTRQLHKAQTAPDGLPDSLVLAAIVARPGLGVSHSPKRGAGNAACPAAGAGADASTQLGGDGHSAVQRTASNSSSSSNNNTSSGNGRPPMPGTPAFASARSGSGGNAGHAPRSSSGGTSGHAPTSYRELFVAQAETSRAQAQVSGLQAALRKKDDELELLRQELTRVSVERDTLRESASASASASGAGQVHGGRGASGRGGAGGLRLNARQVSAGPGLCRGGRAAAAACRQPAQEQPAVEEPSEPTMVSAFAGHSLPFSFE